jgi:hypothetical protein
MWPPARSPQNAERSGRCGVVWCGVPQAGIGCAAAVPTVPSVGHRPAEAAAAPWGVSVSLPQARPSRSTLAFLQVMARCTIVAARLALCSLIISSLYLLQVTYRYLKTQVNLSQSRVPIRIIM